MTYLVAFIILANGVVVNWPLTVHGSLQSCEVARVKVTKEVQRENKNANITSVCVDR
jgi:hypothetical protein